MGSIDRIGLNLDARTPHVVSLLIHSRRLVAATRACTSNRYAGHTQSDLTSLSSSRAGTRQEG